MKLAKPSDWKLSKRWTDYLAVSLTPTLESQLPPEGLAIARRLIAGSNRYYGEVLDDQRLMSRRMYDVEGIGIGHHISLAYKMLAVKAACMGAWRAIVTSLRKTTIEYLHLNKPADPRDGQNPKIGAISCIDSRINLSRILNAGIGEMFIEKVAGAALLASGTAAHEAGTATDIVGKLSPETLKTLSFYCEKGVETLLLATHGLCGAVEHSFRHCCKGHTPLPEGASMQQAGLHAIGESMRHVFNLVQKHGRQHYLDMLQPVPKDMNGDADYLAMEIALGLYNYELAREALSGKPIKIVMIHMDLRSFNPYMYNPATGKFVALTDHPPLLR